MSKIVRNISFNGRRTSLRLEPEYWSNLDRIAQIEQCNLRDIIALVDITRPPEYGLTSAVRIFTCMYFKAASTEEGHRKAGHGHIEFMKSRCVSSRA